jgi:hypothetical protein
MRDLGDLAAAVGIHVQRECEQWHEQQQRIDEWQRQRWFEQWRFEQRWFEQRWFEQRWFEQRR